MGPENIPQQTQEDSKRQLEMKKQYWNNLIKSEQELILDSTEEEWASIIRGKTDGNEINQWKFLRQLMENFGQEKFLSVFKLKTEEGPQEDFTKQQATGEDSGGGKIRPIQPRETENNNIVYTILPGKYSYSDGLTAIQNRLNTHEQEMCYPTQEEAETILREHWEKLSEKTPVACFIDEKNCFCYLSKTGQDTKKEGTPPVDTSLLIVAVAKKRK